jgi:hypothetical protein
VRFKCGKFSKAGLGSKRVYGAGLKKKLANYNIGPADILLIDPVSNSTFCGTDTDGNLVDPVKIDNTWHIPGDLNIRPKSYLKIALGHLKTGYRWLSG